jgi:hypothetical protein
LRQRARAPLPEELAMVPWLELLDATERARVVAALQVVEASPGDYVCKIGRQANYWFGVLDGLLKMSNDSAGLRHYLHRRAAGGLVRRRHAAQARGLPLQHRGCARARWRACRSPPSTGCSSAASRSTAT